MFQFLIGSLEARYIVYFYFREVLFQFLIGSLEAISPLYPRLAWRLVSIPHR